jgi:hypothetical protein
LQEFISEDELDTFEGWLRYQALDQATMTPDELAMWLRTFEESKERSAANPKVGLMNLKSVPGEHRYAVALQDGSDLWLALWVRRSRKGEFFVMVPRGDRGWDPHTSYHLDGTLHMKSHGMKLLPPMKRQALTGDFRGHENLGAFSGNFPKGVGAICDPAVFSGVVVVERGVLGPRHGAITVDLVEPGCEPAGFPWKQIVVRQVFRDVVPWVVLTVGSAQ